MLRSRRASHSEDPSALNSTTRTPSNSSGITQAFSGNPISISRVTRNRKMNHHHRRGSSSPPRTLEPDSTAVRHNGRSNSNASDHHHRAYSASDGDMDEKSSHNPYASSSSQLDIESMYPLENEKYAGAGPNGGVGDRSGPVTASSSGNNSGFSARRGAKMSLNFGWGKDKEGSMLSSEHRRRGISRRSWLIIGLVVAFFLLTRRAFGATKHPAAHVVDTHDLIPRDYLNNSHTDPAPFAFCPVFGPGDAIAARRGQFDLLRSRLHMGSGARIQRVLQKAMTGAPITFSVLGGSVSACIGAGDDPIHEKCYPSKFFNWWNTVFPNPANELTNGASKKTDSAYYAYCNAHHLPDKTDVVILEFDAADPNDPEWAQHFELLVRSSLVRPDVPAVIILGHFSPQVQAQHGYAGPEILHSLVAQFYDVPHISVKGLMYEEYLHRPEQARSYFYPDAVHANADGHDLITDVLISYMMSQICAGWATVQGRGFEVPSFASERDTPNNAPSLLGGVGLRKGIPGQEEGDGDSDTNLLSEQFSMLRVPNARLADRPHDVENFREIEPHCVSAGDLVNPLPNSLFFGSGWHTYHPAKSAVNEDRHYWYAEQPTARLRIPIRLGAGDVGIYYLQAPPEKPLGVVKCWVDDNYGGAKELHGTAEVQEVVAKLDIIDRKVPKGSHYVECQLQGEAGGSSFPFKILGMHVPCHEVSRCELTSRFTT